MVLVILLYALCASTFTICKALLLYAKPLFVVGVRMLVAGLILYCYQWWSTRSFRLFAWRHWFLFLQIILFHIYFAYTLDLWSLQYLTSIQSSFIYNISPLLSALFSYLCFSEKMTLKKWIGLFIGFSGFLPEIFMNVQGAQTHSIAIPALVLMGGVTSAVYGWIVMRTLVKEYHYSPVIVNGVGMMGGGILALLTSLVYDGWHEAPVTNIAAFVKLLILIVFIANIVFYNFYGYLLKKYTATLLSFAGFSCPLFAALFGWLFLGETVHYTFFLSLAVVGIGLYIFYQEELRQGYIAR